MRAALLLFLTSVIFPSMLGAQSYGDLDTRFTFSLFRSEIDPIGLIIALTTTADYPCDGYTLRTRVSRQRDTITVSILGMLTPNPCNGAFGRAKGSAFLGNQVAGKYFVRLYYRGVSDLYRLSFDKGKIILSPIIKTFTEQKPLETYDQK